MADRTYPLLPPKNWWIIRNRFKQSVPAALSKNYLSTVLGISEKAAANVLPALKQIGLTNDEGRTTDRAKRWRDDSEYGSVCAQIVDELYPEELIHAVPDPTSDFEAAVRWFMRDAGVGEGAAKNMARLYQLLQKAEPSEGNDVTASKSQPKSSPKSKKQEAPTKQPEPKSEPVMAPVIEVTPPSKPVGSPTLHIDVQVHISPDSSPEQIDTIFASMAKHLYKPS